MSDLLAASPRDFFPCKAFGKERNTHGVAQCPLEFLVIHRVHFHLHFLAGNDNIFDVLPYGNERTCFHVIIPVVFHKILYRLPCFGSLLYLVEYDGGLAHLQFRAIDHLQA